MGICKFYKEWILQEYVETVENSGDWELRDSIVIMGMFRLNNASEGLTAATPEANTRGRFVCNAHENEGLRFGAILRCGGLFIRLDGDAVVAPSFATVKIMSFNAIVTSQNCARI